MVHTIFHRGLTPQTVTHAWLVLTVALTFALAIAHAATHGGPLLAGDALRISGAAVAHRLPAAPAATPAPSAADTVAAEREDDRRDVRTGDLFVPSPAPATPAAPDVSAPAPRPRGASALAELYGGAGPHGPPAPRSSR
jgi:hypothetical protein